MDVGISSSCAGNRFLRFGRNILGDVVPRWSPLPSLFSYQNWTGDYGAPFCPSQTQCTATALAVHCNRSCSALHPSLQCTASSTLIRATFPASTCIRPCKYVRPRKISEWMEPSVEMRGSEKLPERGLVWIKRKVYKVYRGKDALRRNTDCTRCLFHIRFLDFSEQVAGKDE